MRRYEHYQGTVMLIIDEGDPVPTAAEIEHVEMLKAAIAAGDHQVQLVPCDEFPGCQRVIWTPVIGRVA